VSPAVRASIVLLVLTAVFTVSWTTSVANPSRSGLAPSVSDVRTYEGIVTSLRAGRPYYETVGGALRAGEYATLEVFNWRTPAFWVGLAHLPAAVSQALMVGLSVTLVAVTGLVCRREPSAQIAALVAQAGAALTAAVPVAIVMPEAWAGVLVGLSLCALVSDRSALGIGAGLLALVARELAAPYCVVATLWSASRRRYRDVGLWLVGAAAYAVYYGLHVAQVLAHRQPSDYGHTRSWIEWGGLPYVLGKVRWHAMLLPSPHWLIAAALAVLVVGTVRSRAPALVRLTSAAYLAFFLVAGKAFDQYWGLVAWPAWSIALGYGVSETWSSLGIVVGRLRSKPASHQGDGA
jgi:hypothetical protein